MTPPEPCHPAHALATREARPGQSTGTDARLSVQTLTREARKVIGDLDLELSQNRLVKLIRRYLNEGRGDIDFRTWFIASYADPTGEQAVRNVMRGEPVDAA